MMSPGKKVLALGSLTGLAGTAILAIILSFLGCISIPATNAAVSMRNERLTRSATPACTGVMPTNPGARNGTGLLDPEGFRVMIWNGMKNGEDAWEEDFLRISRDSDLVLMQEAYLTGNLEEALRARDYLWDLSVSFLYLDRESGVLTASKAGSDFLCTERNIEPLLRTPKSILVTRYPLSGTEKKLLVVNIHSINFTLDTEEFASQLRQLEPVLSNHRGPIILAGDFNTWSDERAAILQQLADAFRLREVGFDRDDRSTFLGHHVDHIYYRGLRYDQARVETVTTSDHNPMTVRFGLTDELYAGR